MSETKQTVYLETTIIGYLAMRVSGVLRVAANQQTTRDWWDNQRHRFELLVSRFVLDECSDGDPVAVQERLAYLEKIRSWRSLMMLTHWHARLWLGCQCLTRPQSTLCIFPLPRSTV
jgi:hypothetical protein